jgi:hypothetical protein
MYIHPYIHASTCNSVCTVCMYVQYICVLWEGNTVVPKGWARQWRGMSVAMLSPRLNLIECCWTNGGKGGSQSPGEEPRPGTSCRKRKSCWGLYKAESSILKIGLKGFLFDAKVPGIESRLQVWLFPRDTSARDSRLPAARSNSAKKCFAQALWDWLWLAALLSWRC